MKFEIKYICITYILGILIGIYLNNYCLSIFFLLCIIWSFMFKNNKKISIVLIILLLSSTYTIFRFDVFNDIIKDADNCVIKGTIIGKEKETQYSIKYKFRVDSYDLFIYIPKNIIYDYGDEIVCKINIEKPLKNTNYGGFNNMMYLYSNNVIAIGYVEKVYSVEKGKGIYYGINRIKQALIEKIDKEYSDDVGNVVKTLVLNDDSTISNEIKDAFYDIGIAHVLVPSSTHLMYILLFVSYIISILNIKNRYKGLINLAVVFVYLVITGFSISLIRVFLIYCVSLIYSFLFIKISRIDKVCLVLLILLIYNPMSIFNIGLLLSFGSVLGIQLFSRKIIYKLQYSINKNNNKIVSNILNILGISLAVQIAIMPIILCCFNKVYITGVLANVIAIPLSGIAIFLSLILFIFFNIPIISNLIIFISTVVIQILLFVLKYFSEFPMASINFFPMNVFEIAIYYFVIFDIFVTKKYLNLLKKIFFKKKVLVVLLILILIYNIYDYLRLEVSFVDQTTPIMIQRLNDMFERNPLISMGI